MTAPLAAAAAPVAPSAQPSKRISSFKAFYPYYQQEHRQFGTRLLHFLATGAVLATVGAAALQRK